MAATVERYRIPKEEVRREIEKVRGSRFIATLAPAATVEEAESHLARVRAEFHDSRHTCSAWRLGPAGSIWRAQDDGEPGGSAGRPILAQLEGAELTNAVLLVTRYFGGTKLGVGGLVRAYGSAAAAAIEAATIREVVVTLPHLVRHPYSCSSAVEAILAAHDLAPRDASYGEEVSFHLDLTPAQARGVCAELIERSSGLVQCELVEEADA